MATHMERIQQRYVGWDERYGNNPTHRAYAIATDPRYNDPEFRRQQALHSIEGLPGTHAEQIRSYWDLVYCRAEIDEVVAGFWEEQRGPTPFATKLINRVISIIHTIGSAVEDAHNWLLPSDPNLRTVTQIILTALLTICVIALWQGVSPFALIASAPYVTTYVH